MEQPSYTIPTIKDIQILPSRGPWPTKSNGQLEVLFSIPIDVINNHFFSYDKTELDKIPQDIRGMRSYRVSALQKGAGGAHEWHRIRIELVLVMKGSVKWTCEDVYGEKLELILDRSSGVKVAPFILHTYESLENDSELLVLTNTLFIPEEPATHDTFNATSFEKLKEHPKSDSPFGNPL